MFLELFSQFFNMLLWPDPGADYGFWGNLKEKELNLLAEQG